MADKPAPVPEKYVYFKDAFGGASKVPAAEAEHVSQMGMQPMGQAEAIASAKADKNISYVDENWGTAGKAAAGAFSGLSLGLGPGLAVRAGLMDPGHLSAAQTSGSYLAGDIAGMMAPALLSGGESVAARGLAATPAGMMMGAGGIAERMAGALLPEATGVLGRLASTPIQMAARGMAEGAIMNVGHQVGENLVQNKPLSAEAWAAAESGALFGGLIGGGFGTMGALGSSAVESVGKFARKAAGGGSEANAVTRVGRKLGAEFTSDELINGGAKATLGDMGEFIQRGGSDVGETPLKQYKAIQKEYATQKAVREAAIDTMDKQASLSVPGYNRVEGRFDTEILGPAAMSPNLGNITKELEQVDKELKNVWKHTDHPSTTLMDKRTFEYQESSKPLHQRTSYDAYKASEAASPTVTEVGQPTWKELVKARDEFAAKASTDVRKQALNIIDSEIESAMAGAAKMFSGAADAAKEYAAGTAGIKLGQVLEENIGKLLSAGQKAEQGGIRFRDLAGSGVVALSGHPITAAAWLANRGVANMLPGRVEGMLAQMAYDGSIAAKAADATMKAKSKIGDSLDKFLKPVAKASKNGAKVPTKAVLDKERNAKRHDWDRAKYEQEADKVQRLLSDNHMARVQREADRIHKQGYPELATAMMALNQRAVMYAMNNMPPRKGAGNIGSLRSKPVSKSLDMAEHKFMRVIRGQQEPLSLMDDLLDGSLSRDSVRAAWNVNPELKTEVVTQAMTKIADMKANGGELDLQKIATLGVLFDAPVDRILEGDYVGAVQMALKAPPAEQGGGPPPGQPASMTVSATGLMTPLQQNVMG